jgi:hypothetical protein
VFGLLVSKIEFDKIEFDRIDFSFFFTQELILVKSELKVN